MNKGYDLYDVSIKLNTAYTLLSMLRDYIDDEAVKTSSDALLFACNKPRMSALVHALIDYVYDSSEMVNQLEKQVSEV